MTHSGEMTLSRCDGWNGPGRVQWPRPNVEWQKLLLMNDRHKHDRIVSSTENNDRPDIMNARALNKYQFKSFQINARLIVWFDRNQPSTRPTNKLILACSIDFRGWICYLPIIKMDFEERTSFRTKLLFRRFSLMRNAMMTFSVWNARFETNWSNSQEPNFESVTNETMAHR